MTGDPIDIEKPVYFMVHYTGGIGESEELNEMISSRFKYVEFYPGRCAPLMGCEGITLLISTATPERRGENRVVLFGTVERGDSYAKETF